ncbi:MAG TPA: DNRLRE domain-containing protein [Thermoanaerobaculia bacterium]|nr:DNRLRE domain-containing protein [Thermoanaerobaculia bacterium]
MRIKILCLALSLVTAFCQLVAAQSQVVLQPGPEGKDLWITDTYSYNSDYGVDDDKLQVGGWGDKYYSLIQFDLSRGPAIADSAILYLYSFSTPNDGTYVSMYLDRITQPWTEDTGWYNKPASVQQATILQAPVPNQWYAIDLTYLYNNWKRGAYPNYGIQLRPTQWCCRNSANFRSSDYFVAAYRPKLVITTNQFKLSFPLKLNNVTPYNANISSVFDHSMRNSFETDGIIVAFNAEQIGATGVKYPSDPTCIAKKDMTAFLLFGNYVGAAECGGKYYLSYDGHPGIDYPVPDQTPVYATADGKITILDCPHKHDGGTCFGRGTGYGKLYIDHGNGYVTIFNHLSYTADGLNLNSSVKRGDLVGYSGHTVPSTVKQVGPHLHLSVTKGGVYVDPYGWSGNIPDPYVTIHPGTVNVNLWQ